MAEKYGIENVKKILIAVVDGAMVVDKLVNHEGLFSIFQFSSDFLSLGNVDSEQLKQEILELSSDERTQLESILKAKLVLHNAALEAKVEKGVDLVEVAIGLVIKVSDFVKTVKDFLQP